MMAQQPGAGGWVTFLPLILIFIILYLFMILPQQRMMRKKQEMLQNLRRGDRVVTNGGLHGQITAVKDKTVKIKIAPNVEITVEKDSISRVVKPVESG